MAAFTGSSASKSRKPPFYIVAFFILGALLLAYYSSSQPVVVRPFFPYDHHDSTTPVSEVDIQSSSGYTDFIPSTLEAVTSKYAYVTLLAPDRAVEYSPDLDNDVYLSALRLLTFQLLHARQTRSTGIPFIIMTVPGIREDVKERLRKDGAIVLEIDHVELPEWISHSAKPNFSRFADMFDKLRAWELTQFDRILFMDVDVILNSPLDGIFESMPLQHPKAEVADQDSDMRVRDVKVKERSQHRDKIELPSDYVFAATNELEFNHKFPPTYEGGDFIVGDSYFNAGFFLFKPSLDVLRYYLANLEIPDSFPTDMMEQNFLNTIHSWGNAMPWKQLDPIWHMHWPSQADLDAGVRSVHEKWWDPLHNETAPYLSSWKYKMDGFFEAWDNFVSDR